MSHSRAVPFSYRPDVDFLRAFAVLSVIINHFNSDLLPNGYLGVDIFFVISGFVITGSVLSRGISGVSSFLETFYAKRIKRIYPALLVYVLIASIAICLVCPYPGVAIKTGVSSLFGVSNIILQHESTNYFSQVAGLNIFLHTWSLSLEEQFYLVYSLAICAGYFLPPICSIRRTLFWLNASIIIISGTLFVNNSFVSPDSAYFLLPSRMWEFSMGAIICCSTPQICRKYLHKSKYLNSILPALIILFCILVFTAKSISPLWATLFVVSASYCFIVLMPESGLFRQAITWKPLIFVGKVSYSLYLWHWFVIVISKWTIGITRYTVPLQIFAIVVLSLSSYFYIERPLRKAEVGKFAIKSISIDKTFLWALLAILFVLMSSLLAKKADLYLGSRGILERGKRMLDQANPSDFLSAQRCASMGNHKGIGLPTNARSITDEFIRNCTFALNPTYSKFVAFVGDSHAGTLEPIYNKFLAKDQAVFVHTRGGCPFPSQLLVRREPFCNDVMRSTEEYLVSLATKKPESIVVVSNFFNWYFIHGTRGSRDFLESRASSSPNAVLRNLEDYVSSLVKFAKALSYTNSKIIVVLPYPEHLGFFADTCAPEWFRPESVRRKLCYQTSMSLQTALARRSLVVSRLKTASLQQPNIVLYDPFPALCGSLSCSTSLDGRTLLYRDSNHLSQAGSWRVYPSLSALVKSINDTAAYSK